MWRSQTICKLLVIVLTLAGVAYVWAFKTWTLWTSSNTIRSNPQPRPQLPITAKDIMAANENDEEMMTANKERCSMPTAIFIFAQMRSGSSFFGEIFNQHPESFYLFEPLWAAQYYDNGTYNVPKRHLKLLQGVANCEFKGLEDIMGYFLSSEYFGGVKKSRALTQLCKDASKLGFKTADSANAVISTDCPILRNKTAAVLHDACRKSRLNVAKIIRIWDINFFEPIVTNSSKNGQDVKIVHLIRDPRAIVASQIRVFNGHKPTPFSEELVNETNTRNLCKQMTDTAQTQDGVPDWLLGRYAVVRYEDVAMTPVAMTEKLYDFLGVQNDDAVFDWLAANTNATKPGENLFSRKRNSRDTVDAWRLKLSLSAVLKVQNICQDALKMFGYRTVKEDAELKDFNQSLVDVIQKDLIQIK